MDCQSRVKLQFWEEIFNITPVLNKRENGAIGKHYMVILIHLS